MKLNIDINDTLYPTLERISQENGLATELYARNIVQTFLEKQYRGKIMDELKIINIDKLKTIKDELNKLTKQNGN